MSNADDLLRILQLVAEGMVTMFCCRCYHAKIKATTALTPACPPLHSLLANLWTTIEAFHALYCSSSGSGGDWWHYVLFYTVHCWDCGLYNILLHVPLSSSSPAEYRITYCWRSRRGCLMIEGSFWISAFEMPNGSRRRRHREWYCTRQEF